MQENRTIEQAMSGKTSKRDKPWLIRTYAGHSTAKASNALYRKNLAKGQTGLSVAFDLPTQTGYDSDHPLARGEVGKVGVPISHLGDMRHLARLLGGDLTIENLPGAGTCFTFRAPLAALPSSMLPGSPVSETVPTAALPGTLLVVERDPALRSAWSAVGEAAGYRATALESRAEALAELGLRGGGVDVVMFGDHDADGYDEIGRSIQRTGGSSPALIMLLAAGYPGDAKRLMEAGFRGYLVKPVAPADLREALEILRRTPKSRWEELFITRHSLAEGRQ